jgi:hypothetical protein
MKVIDLQTPEINGKRPSAVGRAVHSLAFLQSNTIPRAQETTIQSLKKMLDNRFLLLRGLALPGLEPPAPLVLAGPPGIWLIEVNPGKGVFRAVDDQWEEMDNQTQKYQSARVNLPSRAASLAQTVTKLLIDHALEVETVEPVIFFTHPGAHVKAVRPPARLVQSDAILRFCTSLLQSRSIYEPDQIQAVIQVLSEPALDTLAATDETELDVMDRPDSTINDQAQRKEILSSQLSAALNTSEPEIITRLSHRMAFSRRQWLILTVLLVINILVLITVIFVVLVIT